MTGKFTRRIQWGKETTSGTAVAATAVARAEGVPEDVGDYSRYAEDVNHINGLTDQYTAYKQARFPMVFNPATFEQICDVLDGGILVATASADGVGTGKVRTYTFPNTSTVSITTKTIEGGDTTSCEEIEYAFVEKLTFAGQQKQACTLNADWIGRQITPTTFTSGLAALDVNPILFGNSKLYIDEPGGTIGTTLVSSTVTAFSLDIETGLVPRFTGDGDIVYKSVARSKFVPTLKLTFEHNTTAKAEKAKWVANTPRLIQLKIEGPTLTTSGTYSKYSAIINMAGLYTKFSALSEDDGNDIIDAEFVGCYDITSAMFGSIIVVNQLATIP